MGIKKMRIRIARDGRTEIRVEGGQGDDCLSFTRAVEEAVGEITQRELTEDYQADDPLTVTTQENLHEREKL